MHDDFLWEGGTYVNDVWKQTKLSNVVGYTTYTEVPEKIMFSVTWWTVRDWIRHDWNIVLTEVHSPIKIKLFYWRNRCLKSNMILKLALDVLCEMFVLFLKKLRCWRGSSIFWWIWWSDLVLVALLWWVKKLSWIVVIHYTDSVSSPDATVTTMVSLPYGLLAAPPPQVIFYRKLLCCVLLLDTWCC